MTDAELSIPALPPRRSFSGSNERRTCFTRARCRPANFRISGVASAGSVLIYSHLLGISEHCGAMRTRVVESYRSKMSAGDSFRIKMRWAAWGIYALAPDVFYKRFSYVYK